MVDRMLRCVGCDKPLLLMTAEQGLRVEAHPEEYRLACLRCLGDRRAEGWPDEYNDAGG